MGTPTDAARAQAIPIEERPSFQAYFESAKTEGTIVVRDRTGRRDVVHNRPRAQTPFLPASTFKVPNSLIAIETGVARDADQVFKWDGVVREITAWNADLTLREAFQASAVPVYQAIARQIGQERMRRFVESFDYGNRDIGGAIDRFWLDGDLRITAFQQIEFLDRLYRGDLPVAARTAAIVKDIMLFEKADATVIRAKTGWATKPNPTIGWWIGWVERGADVYLFALNIDIREPAQLNTRVTITKAVLRELGAL